MGGRRERSTDPISISLSFDLRTRTFNAAATYKVGQNTRLKMTVASGRVRALKRILATFRKNGHGGRRFLATDEQGIELGGVVPGPKQRLVIEDKQGKLIK